jgi:hypothetical protein
MSARRLAAGLAALGLAGRAGAQQPAPPEPPILSEEDRALLENLELLLDWDLLREWDPGEVPLESVPGPAREREVAR